MHFRIYDQRAYPAVIPGIVLHVHDPFPPSRVQDQDGRIHIGGVVLVLTYGILQEERGETEGLEQLWADNHGIMG